MFIFFIIWETLKLLLKQYQHTLEIFFAYFNNFVLVMVMVKKKYKNIKTITRSKPRSSCLPIQYSVNNDPNPFVYSSQPLWKSTDPLCLFWITCMTYILCKVFLFKGLWLERLFTYYLKWSPLFCLLGMYLIPSKINKNNHLLIHIIL